MQLFKTKSPKLKEFHFTDVGIFNVIKFTNDPCIANDGKVNSQIS